MHLANSFLVVFCCLRLEVKAQIPYSPATRLLLPGAECALFPATAALPDAPEFDEAFIVRFAPTWPQVVETEQTLSTALAHPLTTAQPVRYFSRRQAIVRACLPAHRRQYFGFYNAQHQACLFINFFYSQYVIPLDPSWLRYYISVNDGGVGFWRIYYNLATHRFYKFSANEDG